MSITRIIEIIKGNEFNVINTHISENTLFYPAYKQALAQLEEILPQKPREYSADPISNIIAFCGERGEGKSSAMKTFAEAMKEVTSPLTNDHKGTEYKTEQSFLERLKQIAQSYKVLTTIDPTQMESHTNILETLLSRLFFEFKEQWLTTNPNAVDYNNSLVNRNTMLEHFQKCYKHIRTIKQAVNSRDIHEIAFEDSLEDLSRLGDSSRLRADLYELIQLFLTQNTNTKVKDNRSNQPILVIPIDDTDLNAYMAYEIMEDVRKYLSLPNVVILMATRIEQLAKMVEKQFRRDLQILIDKGRIREYELQQMSFRYIDKLIPDGRKIYLPQIKILPDNIGTHTQIRYIDRHGNDLLAALREQNNSMEADFQKDVLFFLYRRTRLISVFPANGLHPLIPGTMRELINFLAVVGDMLKIDDPIDDEAKCFALIKNLDAFLHYFTTTWINSNVDDGYISYIHNLLSAPLFEKHRSIVSDIFDILDNTSVYSLRFRKNKNVQTDKSAEMAVNRSLREMAKLAARLNRKKSLLEYSIGDVMDMLCILEENYPNESAKQLCFAIRIIYTILLHEMYLSEYISKKNDLANSATLEEWIGGDLFGRSNEGKFFPKNSKEMWDEVKIRWKDLNQDLRKFVYGHYADPSLDYLIYKEELSQNKTPFTDATFSISAYLFKDIVREKNAPIDVALFFLNMNIINHIIQIQPLYQNKEESILSKHISNFYNNIHRMLHTDRIIGNMARQETYSTFSLVKSISNYITNLKDPKYLSGFERAYSLLPIEQIDTNQLISDILNAIDRIRPRTHRINVINAMRQITDDNCMQLIRQYITSREYYSLLSIYDEIIRADGNQIPRRKELLDILTNVRNAICPQNDEIPLGADNE